jgi:hypothetical protein
MSNSFHFCSDWRHMGSMALAPGKHEEKSRARDKERCGARLEATARDLSRPHGPEKKKQHIETNIIEHI